MLNDSSNWVVSKDITDAFTLSPSNLTSSNLSSKNKLAQNHM